LDRKAFPTGSELLGMPGPRAELVLNTLPFSTQLACVLQVPWKNRMDVIMQSESARELVQALPPEEVFWMVKQRGVEDSLPVIARTTHEQFQFMIDLDCWQRDELVPENCLSWYRILGRCNIAKVLEWFEQADESLLVAGLKQFVSIHKIEEESDISEEYEDMPPCTIDGINFFRFVSEEAQVVLFPLFKVVRNNNAGLFQTLIEGLIWDSRIEAEDEALHWRQSRAAENGFPLFDEALAIYQPLSSKALQQRGDELSGESAQELQPPGNELQLRYAVAEGRLPAYLLSSLTLLDAEQLERFEQVLITTANKVLVADCMEVRDLEDVRGALHKAAGFIAVGLEHMSAGNQLRAQALLASEHPEILFRRGFTLVNEIAQSARNHKGVIRTSDAPRFISFYGTPLADTVLGLVRSRPLFYAGLLNPGSSQYRDFESLADVEAAAGAAQRLRAAGKLLFECAGLDLHGLEQAYMQNKAVNDPSELTMSSLLATMLICRSLGSSATRLPLLEERELSVFARQVLESGNNDTVKGLEIFIDDACSLLENGIAHGEIDSTVVRHVVQDCLSPLQEVLDIFSRPEPDSRYVSAVLVKRA
jgi:hypothetical protein